MKAFHRGILVLFALGGSLAQAQITWDIANSSWGSGSAFTNVGGIGLTDASPDGSTAYGGSITSGTQYSLGFVNSNAVPTGVADYNLAGLDLDAGTALHLVLTGLSATPRYIAYTGGALTSYSYSGGTLTLDVSTSNPVASASDAGGTTLQSAFGLVIETGGSYDFGGAIFRTDMYWGDTTGMSSGYAGTAPLTGLNANGQNGSLATFYGYLPINYLATIGINAPADAQGLVQKSDGTNLNLALTTTLYTAGGVDPGLAGTYTVGGATTFDFDGGGADAYALVQYANDSWSTGNIGLSTIPESSTYALWCGVLALVAAGRRRLAIRRG